MKSVATALVGEVWCRRIDWRVRVISVGMVAMTAFALATGAAHAAFPGRNGELATFLQYDCADPSDELTCSDAMVLIDARGRWDLTFMTSPAGKALNNGFRGNGLIFSPGGNRVAYAKRPRL